MFGLSDYADIKCFLVTFPSLGETFITFSHFVTYFINKNKLRISIDDPDTTVRNK